MFWEEMSYNKYNYKNKNRTIEEEWNEELDKEFENNYGLDIEKEFIDWEE